jgi:hypothetical protein
VKTNPDYPGREESGCGRHHHRSLHWQVAVGRLFQVHVWGKFYEPGSRTFTFSQNLKED